MIYHRQSVSHLLLVVLLAAGSLCVFAACGISPAPQDSRSSSAYAAPPAPAPVYFDHSVSQDGALRAVTDLGLQPSAACGYEDDLKAGRVITDMRWQPAGQRIIFPHEHRLFVAFTPLTAPDWITRLSNVPGWVANNSQQRASQPLSCPDLTVDCGESSIDSATSTGMPPTSP